ncbi:winged helix-turn-helix transcriptional regulator [Natrarchaeobius halalkaliphilus]|uniref:Winged helix-turn-helix transcriptional regulator n=1 Tax=Natrarchaeobius halalkaliphilus TaxID=1679091 RepID=A0A3N6M8Z5_9EURY|nr:helix-turn-helix domain-containing protein [Natrarchaeobius halalkaliphilus]RQG89956.1 winged helix-turn-helix transcriptional regulator [Natrarchaeobius halalkaliphilus]
MSPDDHSGREDGEEQPLEGEEAVVDEEEEMVVDDDEGIAVEADRVRNAAAEEVDQRIVDLLSWILDTETRAKIYVHLLANPGSTSEEVAKGTGLYPSTVREALAELHDEERVTREKRASEGAGNNPFEYTAIQPSELVGGVVDQVQRELNTIFTLDRVLDRNERSDPAIEGDVEPVTITVDEIDPFGDDAHPSRVDESADDGQEDDGRTDIEISEPDDDTDQ